MPPLPDPFVLVNGLVKALLFECLPAFERSGTRMYASLAVIALAWFGIQSVLDAADGGPGFTLARFSSLLMLLSFGYTITTYYFVPIPFLGMSFVDLVVKESNYLASTIGVATLNEVVTTGSALLKNLGAGPASALNFGAWATYLMCIGAIAVVEAILYAVILFGFIAQGVLILLGPIFVPFLIAPKFDWLFWGWLRAFLAYSFYQVVGNAFVYVLGGALLKFILAFPSGWGPEQNVTVLPVLLIWVFIALFGLVKIPVFTYHIFSGSAGASSGILEAATGFVGGMVQGAGRAGLGALGK
jgi:hypothetical protein